MKVLIAGGGIGGLTAALCCLHQGLQVEIFERASELSEIGAGIQLSPNAMHVMRALGLDSPIKAKGFLPEKIETRMGKSGRVLFAINAQQWDAPYVHIHRADLIEILRRALSVKAPGALKLGAEIVSYNQTQNILAVQLKDGRHASGDYLIGADGIHSAVRAQMHGADNGRFTGNVAWRAIVPTDQLGALAPAPNATVWTGHKRHAVTYRLRGGALTNFVGVVERSDWQDESWTQRGDLGELQKDFAGWHPIIANLIENIVPDNLYRWGLFDRPPLEQWRDGRAILMGDAAHPMLPFMAQGGAMAIEDAWVLAQCLNQSELENFEILRAARTGKIQAQSRANMKTFHRAAGLGKISYLPMWLGGKLAPAAIKKRLGWIYKSDVTSTNYA